MHQAPSKIDEDGRGLENEEHRAIVVVAVEEGRQPVGDEAEHPMDEVLHPVEVEMQQDHCTVVHEVPRRCMDDQAREPGGTHDTRLLELVVVEDGPDGHGHDEQDEETRRCNAPRMVLLALAPPAVAPGERQQQLAHDIDRGEEEDRGRHQLKAKVRGEWGEQRHWRGKGATPCCLRCQEARRGHGCRPSPRSSSLAPSPSSFPTSL
mmetsp:Transcript_16156/g.39360  ORF Transcript_16156/g.39360 Transcript_16156/m.39360 type:complete len:207 (+) Transcript_16156:673-1293(+)